MQYPFTDNYGTATKVVITHSYYHFVICFHNLNISVTFHVKLTHFTNTLSLTTKFFGIRELQVSQIIHVFFFFQFLNVADLIIHLTLIVASDDAEKRNLPEGDIVSDVTDPKCPDSDWLCICV